VDWIIEAVIEQADVKSALLDRVDRVRRPGSIVSSNTSGLSISALAEARSADFRRHWLGTHFFNPPRYLQLVEIIPTRDTDPGVASLVEDCVDRRLGKSVVTAKDTPGFIANHVAMHGLIRIFEAVAGGAYRGGDRRDHGHGDRTSQERNVSHGRYRRTGRVGTRRGRSGGAPALRRGLQFILPSFVMGCPAVG
jgi:hypothetical protein